MALRHIRKIPKEGNSKNQTVILVLCFLSLLFFVLARFIPLKEGDTVHSEMIEASKIMSEALNVLREYQKDRGLICDEKSDINQTGLIGLEFSPLTTSIGSLGAKRTTTNPNFAALVVFLLNKASVKKGDTIAVGASGSFPALIVAVLSAAKAMDLSPLLVCSLGASQWGANNPDFHWLHMQSCLLNAGIFDTAAIALSVGGEKDIGEDMDPEGRSFITREIQESGILFIQESNLRRNVEVKMNFYAKMAGQAGIKAFVNIGGSWSNMGEDSKVLDLKPGLVKIRQLPESEKRGILFEMAAREIPVIHLLYIKGLVERYGLVWDPVPLPKPGEGEIFHLARGKKRPFLFLAALYFLLVGVVLIFRSRLKL